MSREEGCDPDYCKSALVSAMGNRSCWGRREGGRRLVRAVTGSGRGILRVGPG